MPVAMNPGLGWEGQVEGTLQLLLEIYVPVAAVDQGDVLLYLITQRDLHFDGGLDGLRVDGQAELH